jgi:hypothetical protein
MSTAATAAPAATGPAQGQEEEQFVNASHFLPLEMVDKCIGSRIWVSECV